MNFANVRHLVIPNGEVAAIACGAEILWRKQKYKKELAYLKSTGTQYIDSGIFLNANCTVDLHGNFSYNAGATRFGARNGSAVDTNGAFSINSVTSNEFRIDFADSPQKVNQWFPSKKQANRFAIDGLTKSATVYFTDGTSESYTYTAEDFTLNHSALIFAFNGNGTISLANDMEVSACKLYDNGTLIRDFVLVLDWNDVPCMYDKVTDELFYNQGTGEFIYA